MKLFSLFYFASSVFAAAPYCEVCVSVLNKAYGLLEAAGVSDDKEKIESTLRKMCKDMKDKDGQFCYYTGLAADSATTMHTQIVNPMAFKKPAEKICKALEKKDVQICQLTYPKPFDYSAINFKKIKVKELKKILGDWGEICKNCLEKDEFVKRVKELMPKHVPKENWPQELKDEL
jgi:hypothetical protein